MAISEAWRGDNMEYMARFGDKEIDLAVVDPPYGISATTMNMGHAPNRKGKGQYPGVSTAVKLRKPFHGRGKFKNLAMNRLDTDWDKTPPGKEYFDELFRVSKNQEIWGGNYFDLPPTRCIVCWDKIQPWDNFSQWEMAWTSFDRPAAMFRYSNRGGANNYERINATEKPIGLYRWVFSQFAKPGDKILDTHGGSFNSRIAAWQMGFDFYGCELSKPMFERAEKSFGEAIKQGAMFSFEEQSVTAEQMDLWEVEQREE